MELSSDIDATLSAAAGGDAGLQEELRQAFIESVSVQADLLTRSRCDGNWRMAAARLKAVAASFHAVNLMQLADEALVCAPGDPVALRAIRQAIGQLRR